MSHSVPIPWEREIEWQLSPGWMVYVVPAQVGVGVGTTVVGLGIVRSEVIYLFNDDATNVMRLLVVVVRGIFATPQLDVLDSYMDNDCSLGPS